jgi:polo-like kinase 4
MEQIASGNTSTVYLVNCKRGRLRNRQLALRKVGNLTSICYFVNSPCFQIPANRSEPTETSLIHLSLSHPCIVSLFSTFSTPSADFYVLELCAGGTLSSYLENSPLSEAHLRGVLKGLFEALVYLKKQGVVHRNIRPSSILLTTDSRIVSFFRSGHALESDIPRNSRTLNSRHIFHRRSFLLTVS